MIKYILQWPVVFMLLILIGGSCSKNNNNSPATFVDVTLYVNDPSFINLNAVGGWVYVSPNANSGSKGIIVYRSGTESFTALERTCTYDPTSSCPGVIVQNNNIIARDSCCTSEYSIADGSVTKGPSSRALSQYHTTFDGNMLHIYN